ncbi:hypothetical protein Taro_021309 [Colocasia esculenta]|uniref:DDE Tnp4 domain-containing protein n=1 Tax=Colocasia esculenta TaxID=4460 RepID=A0A843V7U8_COLES|nr:hypothetical protein [Colocasia esculenta]
MVTTGDGRRVLVEASGGVAIAFLTDATTVLSVRTAFSGVRGVATWSLSRRADRSHLGGRRFKTEAAPHFPLSPFLFSFFLLRPLLSSLVILRRFLVLVVLALRWCCPVHAGDVLMVHGARRRWSFRREGPNGSALLLEVPMVFSMLPSPYGKYYLVDSGYGNAAQFLTPYRGERYHISEYQNRGNAAYKNMRDKFNHRHAQFRKCVERCFSVLKNRFQTLMEGNCYPFRVQVLIVLACCVVHNFIRREHGEDYYFNLRQMDNVEDDDDPPDDPNLVVTPPDMQAGEILRTQIATQIWANN